MKKFPWTRRDLIEVLKEFKVPVSRAEAAYVFARDTYEQGIVTDLADIVRLIVDKFMQPEVEHEAATGQLAKEDAIARQKAIRDHDLKQRAEHRTRMLREADEHQRRQQPGLRATLGDMLKAKGKT